MLIEMREKIKVLKNKAVSFPVKGALDAVIGIIDKQIANEADHVRERMEQLLDDNNEWVENVPALTNDQLYAINQHGLDATYYDDWWEDAILDYLKDLASNENN